MSRRVCIVTGVGPGTGAACVRRFAKDYDVALIARNRERLEAVARDLPGAQVFPCDVSDAAAFRSTLEEIRSRMGAPEVAVHNAVGGAFGNFLDVESSVLQKNFEVNTLGLLHLGQVVAPDMIAKGHGSIVVTGNTAAWRGVAHFAGFAPTKAAQRILAESMARHLGPLGVHVSYVAIDAVIDLPWTRKRWADKPDEFFCKPDDIAEECFRLAHQPKSAWTFSSVVRPFGENWTMLS
ncbi:MAG: SDR family NAD(P)-dependent oxidoreductase [Gammaproteobacteria bacterium]|nr:SDR family NAD(P)-dependent oxidoreductase [Gammaproteobacteria bacterium]